MKKLNLSLLILLLSISMIGFTGCKDPEPAHEHTFSDSWSKDETYHWHAATCEHTTEVSGKTAHSFGDWTTTKEATEEAEGSKERTCTVCGYTATDVIEKLAHTHKFATDWSKDETHHWHAATCGHYVTDSKSAHTFGEYVSNNDATTEADGTKTRKCSVCGCEDTVTDEGSKIIVPEMVLVKGGTVTGAAYTNNHTGVFGAGQTVTLSDFYMGKYEVTQEEYASVMAGQKVTVGETEYTLESNPSKCKEDSTSYTLFNGDEQGKRPVEGVTWYDAVWYCNALSEKEGLTKAYNIEVTKVYSSNQIREATVTLNEDANGYRLPTEAEWEYAARGGNQTAAAWNYVFSGADTAEDVIYSSSTNSGLDTVGWYCFNNKSGTTQSSNETGDVSGKGTHQVGKKAANGLGLYDMSGNVLELCYDLYGSGNYRVRRGGSWKEEASYCSVSYRNRFSMDGRSENVGFRVVRSALAQ